MKFVGIMMEFYLIRTNIIKIDTNIKPDNVLESIPG